MNARDERGKRLAASYFDPGAERLSGARKRAELDGPFDHNTDPAFIDLRSSDWKEAGELERLLEVEDELEEFNPDEDHWRELDWEG